MDNRAVRVFLACALGAGVGSLIALHIHSYLWWVGLLVGLILGYVSYDVREILTAAQVAFKVALRSTGLTLASKSFWAGGFRVCVALLVPVAFTSSLVALYFGLSAYLPWLYDDGRSKWIGYFSVPAGMLVFAALYWSQIMRVSIKRSLVLTLALTPLGVIAMMLFVIGWTITKSPKIATFCVVFVKTLFLLIHSDIRLLCGVDATIGASIGLFFLDPILGAVAGGTLGVLNYKLVSQKWLRLHLRVQNG